MIVPKSLWLPAAFVAELFLAGIPYWQIPYSKVNLPDALIAPGLAGLGVLTLTMAALELSSPRRIFIVMSLCLPAAIIARVLFDTARDPTSHNLWPFEVVIGGFLGVICLLPGLLAGWYAAQWIRKGSS